MPKAHRNNDARFCGARTIVQGQSTVFVNDKLWAVEGDPNTHVHGELQSIYSKRNIFIENKRAIVAIGDRAAPDGPNPLKPVHPYPPTDPLEGSFNVIAYDAEVSGKV